MKTKLSLFILLFAPVWLAHAQVQVDAESKVMTLERLWGSAAQSRDIKALDTIFDASMAYVHIDGRLMSKAEVLADTKAVSPVEISMASTQAHSHGNVVIVTGVMRLKGVQGGKPYVLRGRFLDAWVERGGNWVCISSMTTAIKP